MAVNVDWSTASIVFLTANFQILNGGVTFNMICPHCDEDSFDTFKVYRWPYGKKVCGRCGEMSRVKKQPLLLVMSFLLGVTSAIPPLMLGSLWLFIPSIFLMLFIDYAMDKKYRVLVAS